MNIKSSALILGLACVAALTAHANPLIVTPTNSGLVLTNAIVGAGINVVGAPSYSGANTAASGTFTGGADLIGISSGIILTTGNAAGAPGPNNTSSYTGSGSTTSLSFNFTTTGGDLFFNYVFASEEYQEYANSQFNDLFQLLVDGVNVAKIPTTNLDVTINNINAGEYSQFFNVNNDGNADVNLQYDGFTDVFTASVLGLSAGSHTIQFLIQDVGDSQLDSAVFIQGGSFSDTQTPVGVPDSGASLGLIALGFAMLAGFRRQMTKA